MDLLDLINENKKIVPLAERMRPDNIKDFLGQSHIADEGSLLFRAISLDRLGSCIFWGPPGTGKTTLAHIIANSTSGNFIKLNAVNSGVADVKKAVEDAKLSQKLYGKKTYLLLDECHRFNKTQSDSLLPAIEQGTIIFIGSTTENPYASLTPALVSRCRVFEFKRLNEEVVKTALIKALKDKNKGLGNYSVTVEEAAIDHIANICNGDLRSAYNALELAVLTTKPDNNGRINVTLKDAEQSIQKKSLSFGEDLYYDILSAFCKSLRGSDSNAALYYSQRLISGGCDPMLLARRLVVHSAEDVGMADPNAMVIATSAMYALEKVGMPEAMIPLANAIVYVCEAPKSNSVCKGLFAAKEDAEKICDDDIPAYLKDNSFGSYKTKNESTQYKYPHDYGGYVEQQYLPNSLKNNKYYIPSDNGFERQIKKIRLSKGMPEDN